MFKRLYDWTLSLAGRPGATWTLGAISFAESSFFPIPPDVVLVPMALARPDKAWFYAAVCTVTSVLGGLLGYAIGALLYDSVGQWLIQFYGLSEGMETFRETYAKYGAWIILIKGATPIPYKLVTIASGFAGYDLLWFVVLSIITRGLRFAMVAGLLHYFGDPVRKFLDEHFALAMGVIIAFVVAGFAVVRYAF